MAIKVRKKNYFIDAYVFTYLKVSFTTVVKRSCKETFIEKRGLTMKTKLVATLIFFKMIFLVIGGKTVNAVEEDIVKINPDVHVLVIYSTENWEVDENIRLLDLSIGHFTNNIEYKNVHHLEQEDLEDKTHLFYYGHVKEKLPPTISEMVSSFEGPTMAISYNTEQLGEKYSFLNVDGEKTITKIEDLKDQEKSKTINPSIVLEAKLDEGAKVLVQGDGDEGTFPLIMRKGKNYYLAADSFDRPYSVYFSQALNTFFDVETIDKTPAYIRLEDVHPLSDPNRLMAAAEELKRRDIPYMIAVIPVYTDPESGRRYHFEDQREVLKVLKYMQNNGGSVVLHGYTHQFRDSETGEGFEFWDVEHQMPIYHGPEDEVTQLLKADFENAKEYETYVETNKNYERQYIKKQITRGVQELANYGLYPLAFEAPHYTMSQNGYQVISDHFSTYVGQVQLSDEDWEIMDTTPYATQPTILNGMRLLPETIGYVQPEAKEPVKDMMNSADFYQVTEGGMLGAFYHPYLGIEGLKEVLDEMEEIKNLEWIDLKEMKNTVVVDHVNIQSENGSIEAKVNHFGLVRTSMDFLYHHIREAVIIITWVIAVIGITSVLMFFNFTLYLILRRRRLEKYVPKHSQIIDKR